MQAQLVALVILRYCDRVYKYVQVHFPVPNSNTRTWVPTSYFYSLNGCEQLLWRTFFTGSVKIIAALQQRATTTHQCSTTTMRHGLKRKMASALDFDPGNSSYWSEHHRDIVFGANYNAFATKFTGFSICHPVYDYTKMLKCVQHSLRSAMCSELPTATFFLPNWETRALMLQSIGAR